MLSCCRIVALSRYRVIASIIAMRRVTGSFFLCIVYIEIMTSRGGNTFVVCKHVLNTDDTSVQHGAFVSSYSARLDTCLECAGAGDDATQLGQVYLKVSVPATTDLEQGQIDPYALIRRVTLSRAAGQNGRGDDDVIEQYDGEDLRIMAQDVERLNVLTERDTKRERRVSLFVPLGLCVSDARIRVSDVASARLELRIELSLPTDVKGSGSVGACLYLTKRAPPSLSISATDDTTTDASFAAVVRPSKGASVNATTEVEGRVRYAMRLTVNDADEIRFRLSQGDSLSSASLYAGYNDDRLVKVPGALVCRKNDKYHLPLSDYVSNHVKKVRGCEFVTLVLDVVATKEGGSQSGSMRYVTTGAPRSIANNANVVNVEDGQYMRAVVEALLKIKTADKPFRLAGGATTSSCSNTGDFSGLGEADGQAPRFSCGEIVDDDYDYENRDDNRSLFPSLSLSLSPSLSFGVTFVLMLGMLMLIFAAIDALVPLIIGWVDEKFGGSSSVL